MPLLHHAVLRLAEICREMIVVIAPDRTDPALPRGVPVRVVHDATEGEGPLAGLVAGLSAARNDLALVAGGDMPHLQTPVLLELMRIVREGPVAGVALGEGSSFRPLPCALRTEAATDAAHTLLEAGRRSLRELLQALRLMVIDEPTWRALDPEGLTLYDVDVPEDLRP